MKTAHELVLAAKQQIHEISPAEAQSRLGSQTLLLDVREPEEFAAGHVPGAINVPRGLLEFRIAALSTNPAAPIVLYCKSSGRAALAAQALHGMGYQQVSSIAGGFEQWAAEGRAQQQPALPSFE